MTTFPNGTPNRALKWNSAGTDLVNSAYDPDLLAETAADLAKAAARSAEQAAEAADDATVKAGTMSAKLDQAITVSAQVANSATAAHTSEVNAAASATQAATSASSAQTSATQAATSATAAHTSEVNAANSATAAAGSATQAATSATQAATSATAAHTSEVNAASSATAAAGSATSAQTSATQAATSATAAHSSEVNAANSATAADGSASSAQTSANNAATSATAAHTSEVNAATSATAAAGSATSAQTSATNAAGSATSAAASATTAQTYAQQVVTAAGQVSASQADIGLLYLGLARVDSPTSPNVGGTQVADEFDSGSGIASLGGAGVAGGYLTNIAPLTVTPAMISAGGNNYGWYNGCSPTTLLDGSNSVSVNGSYFWVGTGSTNSDYLQIDCGAAANITSFGMLSTTNANFGSWTLQYSDNGSSWSNGPVLVTVQGQWATVSVSAGAHRYWRLLCGFEGSGTGGTTQIRVYGTVGSVVNSTTVSNAYIAQSAPAAVTLVAEYQDVAGTSVVGTDITFEVSRDNGTTWTPVTMSDFGPSPTGGRVLKGSADVSGQPTGSQVKWRVKTFNAKEQRVHGLWMQWK